VTSGIVTSACRQIADNQIVAGRFRFSRGAGVAARTGALRRLLRRFLSRGTTTSATAACAPARPPPTAPPPPPRGRRLRRCRDRHRPRDLSAARQTWRLSRQTEAGNLFDRGDLSAWERQMPTELRSPRPARLRHQRPATVMAS
jgi:hypothetical protein